MLRKKINTDRATCGGSTDRLDDSENPGREQRIREAHHRTDTPSYPYDPTRS